MQRSCVEPHAHKCHDVWHPQRSQQQREVVGMRTLRIHMPRPHLKHGARIRARLSRDRQSARAPMPHSSHSHAG